MTAILTPPPPVSFESPTPCHPRQQVISNLIRAILTCIRSMLTPALKFRFLVIMNVFVCVLLRGANKVPNLLFHSLLFVVAIELFSYFGY